MHTILLIILILLLLGASYVKYATDWGYYPSGGIGLVLLIVVIPAVTRRL